MRNLPRPSRAAVSLVVVVLGVLAAALGAGLTWAPGNGLMVLGGLAIVLGVMAGWDA